jgi:DNA-binding transcriptional ArsR family regulator
MTVRVHWYFSGVGLASPLPKEGKFDRTGKYVLFDYHGGMRAHHPTLDQMRLENVLAALSNPMRLTVVRRLAEGGQHPCGSVLSGVSKSTLTHHWRVLRDAGVIWQQPSGRENLLSLRREDLDARFPGLLDAVLANLTAEEAEPGAPTGSRD